ncbi:hypothetical protein CLAIMM_15051 [Cladophialophora immunda]|nr:hypothetical protein CLAIMM_15051 [Cladophialophora immunda]
MPFPIPANYAIPSKRKPELPYFELTGENHTGPRRVECSRSLIDVDADFFLNLVTPRRPETPEPTDMTDYYYAAYFQQEMDGFEAFDPVDRAVFFVLALDATASEIEAHRNAGGHAPTQLQIGELLMQVDEVYEEIMTDPECEVLRDYNWQKALASPSPNTARKFSS